MSTASTRQPSVLSVRPVRLREANAFVAEHHRHLKPVRGCIAVAGVEAHGKICGVAIVGRPLARLLDDRRTAEVTRCCTDGTPNACSMLYRATWRSVKALGYRRLITYTLPREGGASLRAAGFGEVGPAGGGRWSRPRSGRERTDAHPLERKTLWEIRAERRHAPALRATVGDDAPDRIITNTKREHKPLATFCLFSGGNDSTVLAHRCREHYQQLAWIDTGTAVPGVAEFVREFAGWIGKPLRVLDAGDAYRTMVLGDLVWWARFIAAHDLDPALRIERFIRQDELRYGRASGGELGQLPHGFPGPGAHGRAYNRLKERQILALLKESKHDHPRSARVMFLSGIRRAESRRRAQRPASGRLGATSAVFASPLIDWTDQQMREYRAAHEIPESPAAALLHRSGECNCGAFAKAGEERAMLKALYPEFFAGIEELEREAEAAGVRWCRWGGYDVHGNRAGEVTRRQPGMLCESCEARQHASTPSSHTRRRTACRRTRP